MCIIVHVKLVIRGVSLHAHSSHHSRLSSPLDEGAFLDHTPPSSSGAEGEGGAADTMPGSSGPVAALAPSLTPASQPTISLLTESSSDSLSVESLTLLPPADSPHLHPCARHSSMSQSLLSAEGFIPEEEEEDINREEGEEEGWLDETETTVKEVTTELVTPTEEEPGGQEITAVKEQTEDESLPAEQTEMHNETIDSPELD